MLYAGGNAVALDALDIGHYELAGEVRVLAHVFEGPAVERGAAHIDSRAEEDIFLAVARFLADAVAVEARKTAIPCSCEVDKGRERRAGIVGPSGLVPFIPKNLRTYAVRAVGMPELGDAEARDAGARELRLGMGYRDLFFKGHAAESVAHPRLERFRRVQVHGGAALRAAGCQRKGYCRKQEYTFHIIDC